MIQSAFILTGNGRPIGLFSSLDKIKGYLEWTYPGGLFEYEEIGAGALYVVHSPVWGKDFLQAELFVVDIKPQAITK